MAPSACLSAVVTLALLLLITGFGLGAGHHTLPKKIQHPHAMIARFLPIANDSAASSPQQSQGHNISARWSAECADKFKLVRYTVVVWTSDTALAGTDGDVRIRLVGDVCQTGWHELDRPFPYNDFERGARDQYAFFGVDVGAKITGAYVYFTPAFGIQYPTWKLTKIDTYYKKIKRPFYWNAWIPVYRYKKLRVTGSNAFAVMASMTTVVVFVVITWFMT